MAAHQNRMAVERPHLVLHAYPLLSKLDRCLDAGKLVPLSVLATHTTDDAPRSQMDVRQGKGATFFYNPFMSNI